MQTTIQVAFPEASDSPGRNYPVTIGMDLIGRLSQFLGPTGGAHRFAIISDDTVAAIYGNAVVGAVQSVAPASDLFTFPAGEANKNRQTWAMLSDELLLAGHGRDSAVIALGGGVTGDLAGFVAATFLRGLPLIQMPTSLLAMIDSSVGGKTGVDTDAGKNLIGSFHQPSRVIADVATLRTLAPEHVRAGIAEALKHGLITDAAYYRETVSSASALLDLEQESVISLIERSVAIKAAVVGADEREGGLRKTLNFGHTVGHAVEALSEFDLLHGEAISIGMVVEARIGEMLGITAAGTMEEIRAGLDRFGLPTAVPASFAASDIVRLTRVDKKAREGQVEYSLLTQIGASSRGSGNYGVRVEDSVVIAALEELRSA